MNGSSFTVHRSSFVMDVIVIGAGAAGLSAARELSGAGKRVVILEARGRIGGRVHTLHLPDLPVPIELGAEFVHGEVDTTFSIIEAAALTAVELPDNHWWSSRGEWKRIADFWGTIDGVRARIPGGRDTSFDAFLRARRGMSPRLRELARTFVEGYHAAHTDRISALALRSADGEQEDHKQFRIANGYSALMAWLHAGLDPTRVELRLATPAEEVQWSRGDVRVIARGETFRARAVVVTVPIGVLKDGAIRFDPPLRAHEKAIASLEAGHVVKIAFRFRERFWDERGDGSEPLNFLHTSDRFMPTWWTAAPVRAPILTGWAGGPAADGLLAEGREAMIERALDAMAAAFRVRRSRLDALLAATYTHDWQADPWSRCAYSYASVGGSGAHEQLAKPLQQTIVFAGEATSSDQTGTVAGAIESGRRAAKQINSAARTSSRTAARSARPR